jgi:restriction system protein
MFKYKYDDLFNPVLTALHALGGSASNDEIYEKLIEILSLSDKEINDIHRGNQTKLTYRSAWAKNYLKRYGLLENSARKIWALTAKGIKTKKVDKNQIKRFVAKLDKTDNRDTVVSDIDIELSWQEKALQTIKNISPDAFERLSQRLLRELGFVNVEVTGKSGDGGIDGKGVIKLGGVLSFHVVFQCKKYNDKVSSPAIRDFRGAMIGRADKGLFITTGNFTRDAEHEARRDGAPPIDLIDGTELVEKLKELELGIGVKLVEEVIVDSEWFNAL